MHVGTAEATPGEITRGYIPVTDLPTGGKERLPVLIAQGNEEGPTLWITASIHGNELTGMAVAHEVMQSELTAQLTGTVVCLPNLNPAGLRRNSRTSYYHNDDPNRYFPEQDQESVRPPRVQELIDNRIYDLIIQQAHAVLSLHTAQVRSRPFVIRGRVPYGNTRSQESARTIADKLSTSQNDSS